MNWHIVQFIIGARLVSSGGALSYWNRRMPHLPAMDSEKTVIYLFLQWQLLCNIEHMIYVLLEEPESIETNLRAHRRR